MAKKEAKKTEGKDAKEGVSKDKGNVKGDSKDSKETKDSKDAKSKSKAGDDKTRSASRGKSQAKGEILQEEPPPAS